MLEVDLIAELHAPFDHPAGAVDAKLLRSRFGRLTEQAIPTLNTHRLDLDDVLLSHWADLRDERDPSAAPLTVELPTLADRPLWVAAFDQARAAKGLPPCPAEHVRFAALRLRVLREKGGPVLDFSVPC
jgi:hypothetical protein